MEAQIGRGGMASVFRVRDETSGELRALKCVAISEGEPKTAKELSAFLEQEFHVLAGLRHPNVVRAFDFGFVDGAAYYTMELLPGRDLRAASAELDWRGVCAILRDVASALALMHSRRLLHRDVTPRNVHVTADGRAKLIDFGAMLPMGQGQDIVGTPAYIAPETLQYEELDGRADLFALGATAYYALTRRNAYRAKDLRELFEAWRTPPVSVVEHNPGVPDAFNRLVLSLVHVNRAARPQSAAEVIERLTAIGDLPRREHVEVSSAYLTTPELVGRDRLLSRVRHQLARAAQGSGAALLFEGPAGAGRSRMLGASALAGKLAGGLVLRTGPLDGERPDYGALLGLCRQFAEQAPELFEESVVEYAPVLGHVAPELARYARGAPLVAFEREKEKRPRVQAAFYEWIQAVAARRLVVLAVDDFERQDEPSAAVVAALAQGAGDGHLLVMAAALPPAPDGVDAPPLRLMRRASQCMKLRSLSRANTATLLRTVFGDVPNVALIADRVHDLAEGAPSATMTLARHLVDRGRARYEGGVWILPSHLDANDMPESVTALLESSILELGSDARDLGALLAIVDDGPLGVAEISELLGAPSHEGVRAALEIMKCARLVRIDGARYELSQPILRSLFIASVPEERRRAHRSAWARRLERTQQNPLRVAWYLREGGEPASALAMIAETAERAVQGSAPRASPRVDSLELLTWAIDNAETASLGARTRLSLRLLHLDHSMGLGSPSGLRHVPIILEQLSKDSGLDDCRVLEENSELDTSARFAVAFASAQDRFDRTPERERSLAPADAIRILTLSSLNIAGLASYAYEFRILDQIPSLAAFAHLSPAIGIVDRLLAAERHVTAARYLKARQCYEEVLARLEEPDHAGLDPAGYARTRFGVTFGAALIDAGSGNPRVLESADLLDQDPSFQVNACRIRANYYLCRGGTKQARLWRRRAERLQIQNSTRQGLDGSHLHAQVMGVAYSDDLTEAKEILEELRMLADRVPGRKTMLLLAEAHYERILGNLGAALEKFETILASTGAGHHPNWPDAATGLLQTLILSGREQDAWTRGREFLRVACEIGLDVMKTAIQGWVGAAGAHCGIAEGFELIDSALAESRARGGATMLVTLLHELRARAALVNRDRGALARSLEDCERLAQRHEDAVAVTRYHRLLVEAERSGLLARPEGLTPRDDASYETAFRDCRDSQARFARALELLVARCGALGGHLFICNGSDLQCVATLNADPLPKGADKYLLAYVKPSGAAADDEATITGSLETLGGVGTMLTNGQLVPVGLAAETNETEPIGAVVLLEGTDRRLSIDRSAVHGVSRFLSACGDATVFPASQS